MPLRKGMEGTNVLLMQKELARIGCHTGALDGIYGPNTVSGVAQFQTACGLYPEEDEQAGEIASRELLMLLYSPDAPTLKPRTASCRPDGSGKTVKRTILETTAPH